MTKMKYLIIFASLSLASCSFISFSDSIPLAKTAIFGYPNVPITETEYRNREFSFAIVYFKKGPMSSVVLSEINNGIMKWIGNDGIILYTKSGVVIKTLGLDHDYEALNKNYNFSYNPEPYLEFLVQLRNPSGIFSYQNKIEYLNDETVDIQYRSIKAKKFVELIHIDQLNLNLENFYWIDENGVTVKSIQHLNPKLPPLTLEYFYKY